MTIHKLAVATLLMKPKTALRPLRPAKGPVMPNITLPGAPFMELRHELDRAQREGRVMKIVRTNLTGEWSLEDHVWNDALETAALHCEEKAHDLCAMNGGEDSWVWRAADWFRKTAAEFRAEKRPKSIGVKPSELNARS